MSTTVYVSIGNSDDVLGQREWHDFVAEVHRALAASSTTVMHGSWFSLPSAPWQNACWCVEFADEAHARTARFGVASIRERYRQDSITWAVADTEFIGGEQTRAWAAEGPAS